jgi:hypothetical protein
MAACLTQRRRAARRASGGPKRVTPEDVSALAGRRAAFVSVVVEGPSGGVARVAMGLTRDRELLLGTDKIPLSAVRAQLRPQAPRQKQAPAFSLSFVGTESQRQPLTVLCCDELTAETWVTAITSGGKGGGCIVS